MPTHQVGDLFIAYAGRDASTTAPTLPTGWTNVGTASINGTSTNDSVVRVACKVATTNTETVTGFTNAGAVVANIYRGQASGNTASCASAILGAPVFTSSTVNTTTTTETFGADTNVWSTSWDVGFGYAPAATGGIGTAPTGMTNRQTQGTIMASQDTNAGVSSFSSANVTLTTAGRIITAVVEIQAPCSGRYCLSNYTDSGGGVSAGTGHADPTSYNVTTGHLLVVFGEHSNATGTGTTTVADSDGNTWHSCSDGTTNAFTDILFNGSANALSCNWAIAKSTDQTTVTITATDCIPGSGCTDVEGVYYDFAPPSGQTPSWDAFASHANATTTGTTNNATGGTMTTNAANDLVMMYLDNTTGSFSVGTSPVTFTLECGVDSCANGWSEHVVWTSSGSMTPTMTASASGIAYGALSVAFGGSSGGASNPVSISDSFTTSPAIAASAGRSAAISDSVTNSDAVAAQATHGAPISESLTSSPAVQASAGRSAAPGDSITTSPAIIVQAGKGAPVSDSVTTSPAVTAAAGRSAALAESITTAPSVIAQAAHNPPISEAVTSSPAIQASAGRSSAISDAFTTSPVLTVQSGKGAPLADAWTTAGALVAQAAHNALLAEGWSTSPSLTANAAHGASNAEAFTTSPTLSIQAGKSTALADSCHTSDAVQVSVVRGGGLKRRRTIIISRIWPPDWALDQPRKLQPFAADFQSFSTAGSMSVGLAPEIEAL